MAPDDQWLTRTVVRGVAWTALVKWTGQVFSWAAVFVLARLLTTSDYGLVGMAGLYLGLIQILTEGGVGTSIVALREMTDEDIAQFHGFALLLGLLGCVLTVVAAVPAGWFFRAPALPQVMLVLSLTAVISSLRVVPAAVLQRDLRFRALALIDGAQSLTTTVTTVGLALLGWSYWSLVGGGLVGALAAVAINLALAPRSPAWPRRATMGRHYQFTREVLVGRLAWYGYTNADFLVAGRMLGAAALGSYTFAWSIASVPVEKVTALVQRISTAAFARLKEDVPAMGRMLLWLTEGLFLLTLPASVGMAAVADDFVRVYLGPPWEAAIGPLRVLAGYAAFRAIVTLLPQVLTMRGETRFLMYNAIGRAVALPAAFLIGSRWGPTGIALGWVIVYPLFLLEVFRRCLRSLGLSVRQYLTPLWPTLRGTMIMLAGVLIVRATLAPTTAALTRLAAQVGLGAAIYLVAGLWPQRERLRHSLALFSDPHSAAPPKTVFR